MYVPTKCDRCSPVSPALPYSTPSFPFCSTVGWTTAVGPQIKESDSDVEVPESFFTAKELETLMEETKPEWVPASSYFTAEDEEGSAGKVGRGGLFVEEPATGARLRRLSNGEMRRTVVCVVGGGVFSLTIQQDQDMSR